MFQTEKNNGGGGENQLFERSEPSIEQSFPWIWKRSSVVFWSYSTWGAGENILLIINPYKLIIIG